MMTPRQRIEQQFKNCLVARCEKNGCSATIERGWKRECTIIDCDSCSDTDFPGNRCDYILFHWSRSLNACALELKGGSIGHASHCVDQLRAGLSLVLQITAEAELPYCRAVLLHGNSPSNALAIKAISKYKLEFRGKPVPIFLRKCGATLEDILPA